MGERLHPVRSVAELTFGALSPRTHPEDFRELRQAFKEEIVEKDTRFVSKRADGESNRDDACKTGSDAKLV